MKNPEESLSETKTSSTAKPTLSLVDEYKVFEEIQRA